MLGIGKNYPGTTATAANPFPEVPIVFLKSMDSLLKSKYLLLIYPK